jgi:hypothetical protein
LLDRKARIDERDDAAIDIGDFDDKRALQTLIIVASDVSESEIVLASCGESIGSIWKNQAIWGDDQLEEMTSIAKREIKVIMG